MPAAKAREATMLVYVRLIWRWGLRRCADRLLGVATLPSGETLDGAEPWRGIIARF